VDTAPAQASKPLTCFWRSARVPGNGSQSMIRHWLQSMISAAQFGERESMARLWPMAVSMSEMTISGVSDTERRKLGLVRGQRRLHAHVVRLAPDFDE
jgi:hypothetical protein